jgi:uncharacterized protein involved in type VI secretion and phage assembly
MTRPMDRNDVFDAISQAQGNRFFGKYRGTVAANVDPESCGRIQVQVPEVLGQNTPVWAMPAAPFAGPGVGFFALPPVGASVWVEFEAGILRYPIWSGCFWSRGDLAAADAQPTVAFLKTWGATIRIDDAASEVKVEVAGATITLTPGQIKISAATITNDANGGKTQLTAAGFDAQQGALRVV